jgi:hypothetical protein
MTTEAKASPNTKVTQPKITQPKATRTQSRSKPKAKTASISFEIRNSSPPKSPQS